MSAQKDRPHPNHPACCAYHQAGHPWYQACNENPNHEPFGMPYFAAEPKSLSAGVCPYCSASVSMRGNKGPEARHAHLMQTCPRRPQGTP